MSIKKLAIMAPELCGAENAKRFGRIAELIWNDEMDNKESVFARNADDKIDPLNRISPAFSWKARSDHQGKKDYIMSLIAYASECHYAVYHGDNEAGIGLDEIKADLLIQEPLYPDVAAIATVESVTLGTWA